MKEVKLGDKTVRVRATPLALLFYKQEFKSDLLGDLAGMKKVQEDISNLDTLALLQVVWAMAKADAYGKSWPAFPEWVASIELVDIVDPQFLPAVMEEAANGFFRSRAQSIGK